MGALLKSRSFLLFPCESSQFQHPGLRLLLLWLVRVDGVPPPPDQPRCSVPFMNDSGRPILRALLGLLHNHPFAAGISRAPHFSYRRCFLPYVRSLARFVDPLSLVRLPVALLSPVSLLVR
ncbi:hypothetical protein EJ02DRAFT_49782 [Clathrospora elynae]|uniref:Uncharacterized protein n=1 Tax=Clathrospora elynae TaxID=706981 RepID=A0A6A5SDK2_9PLEO|nr:hypothetical protein EJ02DRAFT_49782 [Clathrospora elynae]